MFVTRFRIPRASVTFGTLLLRKKVHLDRVNLCILSRKRDEENEFILEVSLFYPGEKFARLILPASGFVMTRRCGRVVRHLQRHYPHVKITPDHLVQELLELDRDVGSFPKWLDP